MNGIYENRHRPLFRFFFRLTGRQATAEDLVHEVFLRMIRYRHTYQAEGDGAGAFESWMYRIARNTLADNARKHRYEVIAGDVEMESVESGRPTPFDAAAKRQDLALLYRALRGCPTTNGNCWCSRDFRISRMSRSAAYSAANREP